jgi:molybdopterin-guanine dinucleotide biosynthesis protein A
MGSDKGVIKWHGAEQRYYMANMLRKVCDRVFISCRADQQNEIDSAYNLLPDTVDGSGPLIAILSAFNAYPEAAWLIVACDLPLLDSDTINYLIANRDSEKIATTYRSPFDSLPEPLITIWEPQSREVILSYYNDGYTCPRKILIRNEERVTILTPGNPHALMNANTPEDAEKVRKIIG